MEPHEHYEHRAYKCSVCEHVFSQESSGNTSTPSDCVSLKPHDQAKIVGVLQAHYKYAQIQIAQDNLERLIRCFPERQCINAVGDLKWSIRNDRGFLSKKMVPFLQNYLVDVLGLKGFIQLLPRVETAASSDQMNRSINSFISCDGRINSINGAVDSGSNIFSNNNIDPIAGVAGVAGVANVANVANVADGVDDVDGVDVDKIDKVDKIVDRADINNLPNGADGASSAGGAGGAGGAGDTSSAHGAAGIDDNADVTNLANSDSVNNDNIENADDANDMAYATNFANGADGADIDADGAVDDNANPANGADAVDVSSVADASHCNTGSRQNITDIDAVDAVDDGANLANSADGVDVSFVADASHCNTGSRKNLNRKKRKLNDYPQLRGRPVEDFNQIVNLGLIPTGKHVLSVCVEGKTCIADWLYENGVTKYDNKFFANPGGFHGYVTGGKGDLWRRVFCNGNKLEHYRKQLQRNHKAKASQENGSQDHNTPVPSEDGHNNRIDNLNDEPDGPHHSTITIVDTPEYEDEVVRIHDFISGRYVMCTNNKTWKSLKGKNISKTKFISVYKDPIPFGKRKNRTFNEDSMMGEKGRIQKYSAIMIDYALWVEILLQQGYHVVLTCKTGRSRSPSIILLWTILFRGNKNSVDNGEISCSDMNLFLKWSAFRKHRKSLAARSPLEYPRFSRFQNILALIIENGDNENFRHWGEEGIDSLREYVNTVPCDSSSESFSVSVQLIKLIDSQLRGEFIPDFQRWIVGAVGEKEQASRMQNNSVEVLKEVAYFSPEAIDMAKERDSEFRQNGGKSCDERSARRHARHHRAKAEYSDSSSSSGSSFSGLDDEFDSPPRKDSSRSSSNSCRNGTSNDSINGISNSIDNTDNDKIVTHQNANAVIMDKEVVKQCSTCRLFLLFSNFYKNKREKDGYQRYCIPCLSKKRKRKTTRLRKSNAHSSRSSSSSSSRNNDNHGSNSLSNNSIDSIADDPDGFDVADSADVANVDNVGNLDYGPFDAHCPVDADGANVDNKDSRGRYCNTGSRKNLNRKKRKLNDYPQLRGRPVEDFNQIVNLGLIPTGKHVLSVCVEGKTCIADWLYENGVTKYDNKFFANPGGFHGYVTGGKGDLWRRVFCNGNKLEHYRKQLQRNHEAQANQENGSQDHYPPVPSKSSFSDNKNYSRYNKDEFMEGSYIENFESGELHEECVRSVQGESNVSLREKRSVKMCDQCKKMKSIADFAFNINRHDKKDTTCRECISEAFALQRKERYKKRKRKEEHGQLGEEANDTSNSYSRASDPHESKSQLSHNPLCKRPKIPTGIYDNSKYCNGIVKRNQCARDTAGATHTGAETMIHQEKATGLIEIHNALPINMEIGETPKYQGNHVEDNGINYNNENEEEKNNQTAARVADNSFSMMSSNIVNRHFSKYYENSTSKSSHLGINSGATNGVSVLADESSSNNNRFENDCNIDSDPPNVVRKKMRTLEGPTNENIIILQSGVCV